MAKAKSQKSLDSWTAQKWRTSDGKPSEGKNGTFQIKLGILLAIKKKLLLIKLKLLVIKKEANM